MEFWVTPNIKFSLKMMIHLFSELFLSGFFEKLSPQQGDFGRGSYE